MRPWTPYTVQISYKILFRRAGLMEHLEIDQRVEAPAAFFVELVHQSWRQGE